MSNDGMSRPWGGDGLRWMIHNREVAAKLPHPDKNPWIGRDHYPAGTLRKLCAEGVIDRAGYQKDLQPNGKTRFYRKYRTPPRVYDTLENRDALNPNRPPRYGTGHPSCPQCGRAGFVNIGDGLRCKACEAVSAKEDWRDE